MRVLWVASEYYPFIGGIETYVHEMVEALSRYCEVALVVAPGQFTPPGSQIKLLGSLKLSRVGSIEEFDQAKQALAELIEKYAPDIIHFGSTGLCAYIPHLNDYQPYVVTVHCKDFTRPWQRFPITDARSAIQRGLIGCSQIIAVSEFTRNKIIEQLPNLPVKVMYPGVRLHIDTEKPVCNEFPNVLTVSRLVARKGHIALLHALEKVSPPLRMEYRRRWTCSGGIGKSSSEFFAPFACSFLRSY